MILQAPTHLTLEQLNSELAPYFRSPISYSFLIYSRIDNPWLSHTHNTACFVSQRNGHVVEFDTDSWLADSPLRNPPSTDHLPGYTSLIPIYSTDPSPPPSTYNRNVRPRPSTTPHLTSLTPPTHPSPINRLQQSTRSHTSTLLTRRSITTPPTNPFPPHPTISSNLSISHAPLSTTSFLTAARHTDLSSTQENRLQLMEQDISDLRAQTQALLATSNNNSTQLNSLTTTLQSLDRALTSLAQSHLSPNNSHFSLPYPHTNTPYQPFTPYSLHHLASSPYPYPYNPNTPLSLTNPSPPHLITPPTAATLTPPPAHNNTHPTHE